MKSAWPLISFLSLIFSTFVTSPKKNGPGLFVSIRSRVIATIILAALLGTGLVGVYSLYKHQSHLHEIVEHKYLARAHVSAREIEIILNEIRGDLFVAASVPPIQGIIRAREGNGYDQAGQSLYEEWVRRLQDTFVSMETSYQRYLQMRFLDESGHELVRVDWDGQQARPIPPEELQNKASRPYFQETMKLAPGQIYISPLDLNQEHGRIVIPYQPTIRLATPVFNRQGERRGLVIINVLAQSILDRLNTMVKEGENILVFLTDQRGYYLHHSAEPEKEWGGPEDLNSGHSLWRNFPRAARQILSGQAGEVETGPWEIFYRPIQVNQSEGSFLVLGLAVPMSLIQAPVNLYLWFFAGVLALSLLLAVGTGYYLSRRITAPLETLRQETRQIAGGKFDRRVQIRGSAEITDLAEDFNRMTSQLEGFYHNLEAEYKDLFDRANDSIFVHDLKGRFLAVNEKACQHLGYSREELLGMSVQDIDTPEAASRIESNLERVKKEGAVVFESSHRRKDGSVMPVEVSATLVKRQGRPVVLSFVRDISARKKAEDSLRHALTESRQRQAEISALLEGSRSVLEYSDFKHSARTIFTSCKDLIGATAGYVALLSEDGTQNKILLLDTGGRPCLLDLSLPMPVRGLRGVVCKTGKAAYENNYPESQWLEYLPEGHVAIENVLFVPLFLQRRVTGLLGLANKTGGFTDHDAEIASAFGDLAAIALDNSRTLESLRNNEGRLASRNVELAAQNAIAATISQSLDLDTMLKAALEKVLEVMTMEAGAIYLLEPGSETLTLRVHQGASPEFIEAVQRVRLGEGISGQAIATGKSVLLDLADYPTERLASLIAQEGFQTLVSTPLICRGQALGAMNLGTAQSRAFTPQQLELLEAISRQISVAIENARLYARVQEERIEEQATLLGLSQDLLATFDPEEIMRHTVATAAASLQPDCADFMVLDEGEKSLTLKFSHGREHLIGQLQTPNTDQSFPGYIVQHKTAVIIEDVATDTRFQLPEIMRECRITSALGVPILAGDRAIGTLIVDTHKHRVFQPEEAHFLSLMAHQAGMAIENTRLYEEARLRLSRLAAISETQLAMTATLHLDKMLNILLQNIITASLIDTATVMLLNPNGDELESIASLSLEEKQKAKLSLKVGEGAAGQVAREGTPLAIADVRSDPLFCRKDLAESAGTVSYLGIPLKAKGKVIGVLNLSTRHHHEFTAEDVEFFLNLGGIAAMAIENARIYGQIEERARELNQEVIQKKQYAEMILRNIADGVYHVDLNRVVLSWSKGAEAITGYTTEEILSRPCADTVRHIDETGQVLCDTERCPFRRVWATGQPVEPAQVFAHHKGGRLVPVAVTAAPIFDEAAKALGAVEVFRDVSKEQQLLQEIQTASRAKSDFLANMSHELRTPLNAIIGFSELLASEMSGPLTGEQKEYLGDIIESSRHLLSLINDILDLSKVEAGRMELELSTFSVKGVIERSLVMFKEKALTHRIRLEKEIEDRVENITADERMIKQVLFNLLSNSMKFTPDGGTVRVRAHKSSQPASFQEEKEPLPTLIMQDWVEISVEDTGIGISEENQERLFQPFQQIDSSLTRRYTGTGLGLHLCKAFVELHGGRIWVESQVGQASKFTFTIPIRK